MSADAADARRMLARFESERHPWEIAPSTVRGLLAENDTLRAELATAGDFLAANEAMGAEIVRLRAENESLARRLRIARDSS